MSENDEIPHLTESYRKARRQYGLFCASLMAWELVGLKPEEGKFASINNVKLTDINALPYVFLALIAYYTFRVINEWFQVDEGRRRTRVAKWDFWVAHAIAILSLAIFVGRRFSDFQIAKDPLMVLLPLLAGIATPFAINFYAKTNNDAYASQRKQWYFRWFVGIIIIGGVSTIVYFLVFGVKFSIIALLLFAAAVVIGLMRNALDGVWPFKRTYMIED